MAFKKLYVGLALLFSALALADDVQVEGKLIDGGSFVPQYGVSGASEKVTVKPFIVDATPVTNEQFYTFTQKHPQWAPQRASSLMVDKHYLKQWELSGAHAVPIKTHLAAPVVNVSWYAARAYCVSHGKRLPTVFEWEYVASASSTKKDATRDPEFIQQLLNWYSRPHDGVAVPIKQSPPNIWGVYDLHGLNWEWTQDFNSVFVAGDNRRDVEELGNLFCGSASASSTDRANYAAYIRYALRNSLRATYTMENLGFRCAKDI